MQEADKRKYNEAIIQCRFFFVFIYLFFFLNSSTIYKTSCIQRNIQQGDTLGWDGTEIKQYLAKLSF